MTSAWELTGAGVALAWLALPLLARAARSTGLSEPASLHSRLVTVLVLSAALLAVPALGTCLPRPLMGHAPVQFGLRILASATAASPRLGPPLISGVFVSPFALAGGVWAAAAALAALRTLVLAGRLRGLVARARLAPDRLQARQRQLARSLGVQPTPLLISDEAAAPFAFGPYSPRVVLPAALTHTLSEAQQDLVLYHELLHVQRGDLRSSLLVNACAALFAGHPRVRGIVQELQLAREVAVDAEAARPNPHAYATLLVEVASIARSGKKLAPVSMDDTALTRRIAMLTNRVPSQSKLGRRRALIFLAVVAAALGLAVPDVLADPPNLVVNGGSEGAPPPFAHDGDIDACFAEALKVDPKLVVDTFVRLEANRDGKVVSASAPTPQSPTFQQCVETKAMGWTLPAPPPGAKPPADAKLMVMFSIRLPKR